MISHYSKLTLQTLFREFADLGVDLDDTLVPTMVELNGFAQERLGITVPIEEYYRPMTELWQLPLPEMLELCYDFHRTRKDQIEVFLHAERVLNEVSRFKRVHLITHRSPEVERHSHTLLDRYFGQIFTSVNHFGYSNGGQKSFVPKSEVCNLNSYQLLVEDSPGTAIDCAERGIWVILLAKPWNRSHIGTGLHRRVVVVEEEWWAEIGELLLA